MFRNSDSDSETKSTMAACKAFDKILDCVKSSNLNFCLQLSPFSANISLKKTLVKDKAGFYLNPPEDKFSSSEQNREKENIELAKKVSDLECVIADLRSRLDESQIDCEHAYKTIKKLEVELNIKQENIETSETEKTFVDKLEKKTEEISTLEKENKQLHNKIDDLQISLQNSKLAATRLNKEVIDNRINQEKKLNFTVKNLKSQIKSWKKELGLERSNRIKAERKLSNIMNDLSKPKLSVSCQTIQSLDVPYLVTDILPPIFGSQLCRRSKTINFISRSLPNLSTLTWVKFTDEDILEDEAEQALNDQYDRQVEEFFEDAKKKSEALRQVYDENYIEELFMEQS